MAALIVGMIGIGWYMTGLAKDSPLRNDLVGLHKSFGSLILILFCFRVVLRIVTKIPKLPAGIPWAEQKLAHLGHVALYLFMLIVPLSGYAMSNMYGFSVNMFGIAMPKLFSADKNLAHTAHEAHEILPYIFLVLIFFHVAAVIKHRFFDKSGNDVLGRML